MQLSIEAMSYGPYGISHAPSGKTVFVSGAVTGDMVDAHIVEEKPSFARAAVDEILESSDARQEMFCPFLDRCGGCPWGALALRSQHTAKEENLRQALVRHAHMNEEELSCVRPLKSTGPALGYRNKVELVPIAHRGHFALGFHGRNPQECIPVKECPLFEKKHAHAIGALSGALGYLSHSHDLRLERVGIRASRRTGALEVALWTPTGPFPRAQVVRVLKSALAPSSLVRVMSKGPMRARRVSKVEVLSGSGFWEETLASHTMRISAPSFFQVNTRAAELLIELVCEALQLTEKKTVLDLYCGAGTFTLPLAERCMAVAAVEAEGSALRDLTRNLRAAKLENVEVIGGDAAREFPTLAADALVVDPPRAGLGPEVIELIEQSSAYELAYVSCDPITLARDLARLRTAGSWRVISVTPVDLFPQSFHCEAVAHLTRIERQRA